MLINICKGKKTNKTKLKSTPCKGCWHPFSTSDKVFPQTSQEVHGNPALYLFDRQTSCLEAWFTCVCTQCELCVNLCATAELDCLELRKCELCAI